jgi:hypothetical protein
MRRTDVRGLDLDLDTTALVLIDFKNCLLSESTARDARARGYEGSA